MLFCRYIFVPLVGLYVCQVALNLFKFILPFFVFEFYILFYMAVASMFLFNSCSEFPVFLVIPSLSVSRFDEIMK